MLILASASPRRLALLAQIGIVPDQVIAPDIDEAVRPGELPRPHVERLAREKAASYSAFGHFVLAADTVVAVGRRILPKPDCEAQARHCLGMLSGRRHHVLTAVTLVTPDGGQSHRLSDTSVSFARLSADDVERYLLTGEWRGKAGGYAIQGYAARFVRAMQGSYTGAVGLPLYETAQLLRGRSYRLL